MRLSLIWIFLWTCFVLVGCAQPPEVERAEEARKQENWDEAAKFYRRAQALYPDNEEYRKRWEEARKKAAEVHYQQGQYYRTKTFELHRALEEYERALEWMPEMKEAKRARSEVQLFLLRLKARLEKAKECLKRKDWFRAEKLLWTYRRYSPTLPEIAKVWQEASQESFKLYMEEGMRYYYLLQYAKALRFFQEAERLRPKDERLRAKLKDAEKKKKSQDLFLAALEALKKGHSAEARAKISKALEYDPDNKRARLLFQEATRKRVKELLRDAKEARKQGKLLRAYAHLREALSLKPSGKLLKMLQDRYRDIRKRLAARLYTLADSLERRGVYASAWLRFKQVDLLWPKFFNVRYRLSELEKRIQMALEYRIVVLPQGSGSKAPKLIRKGALKSVVNLLTSSLAKELPTPPFYIYPYVALDKNYRIRDMPVSAILGVRLDKFEISFSVDRKSLEVPITARGKKWNSTKLDYWEKLRQAKKHYLEVQEKLARAEARKRELAKRLAQAKKELQEYLKKHPPKKYLTPEEEASDPRTEDIKKLKRIVRIREVELQQYTSSELAKAQQTYAEAKRQYEQWRQKYLNTPAFEDTKEVRQYHYLRLHVTKTGEIRLKLILWDLVTGEKWADKSFDFRVTVSDTTQKGLTLAGIVDIPDDPLRLPSNQELEEKLKTGLLKKVLPFLKKKLSTFQERFSKAKKKAHQDDVKLHFAVLAFLAHRNFKYGKSKKPSKEKKQEMVKLAQEILELTGFDIENNQLVPEKLRF